MLERFRRRLLEWAREAGEKATLTGSSSSSEYAVMAREPIQSFYCSNLDSLLKRFGSPLEETARFPNVELIETDEEFGQLRFPPKSRRIAGPNLPGAYARRQARAGGGGAGSQGDSSTPHGERISWHGLDGAAYSPLAPASHSCYFDATEKDAT